MKKLLLTGINGFIGSHAARYFKDKFRVAGLGPQSADQTGCAAEYFPLKLPDTSLCSIINTLKPDICIHCAGPASVPRSFEDPESDFTSGPAALMNLLEALRKKAPECLVIFPSSAAVYGAPASLPISEKCSLNPISPYGCHKMICENLLNEYREIYGINSITLRVFSCYGEGLKKQLLWDIGRKIRAGKLELFGSGVETRDFIHVSAVARAMECVSERGKNGCTYNVATGRSVTVREIAEWMVHFLAKPSLKPVFNNQVKAGDPSRWQADITLLKGIGFAPSAGLEEGIRSYCRWFESVQ